MKLFKKKNKLSVSEMVDLEKHIKKHQLSKVVRTDNLLDKLSLDLEIVDANDDEWNQDTEAVLTSSTNSKYNGIIKIISSIKNDSFAYTHEIIHYILDVGISNEVQKTYTRKIRGKTPDTHEQEINYITAASIMPIDEIRTRLEQYDKSSPKEDELLMIDELCKKYNQSEKVVLQRIKEVRAIDAYLRYKKYQNNYTNKTITHM